MSNYNGRRGPNVSQYLRDLNAINRHEPVHEEPFNMEEDLALFTNTQFFDFETGQNTDYQAHPVKVDVEASQTTSPSDDMTPAQSVMGDLSSLDFIQISSTCANRSTMAGDFSFPDFTNAYPSTPLTAFPDNTQNFPSMQPNSSTYPQVPQTQHHQQPQYGQSAAAQPADKRKSESGPSPGSGRSMHFEEASRQAAEDDKRRRNTAASARFRIKKKQREQALEKSAKEMSEKVSNLESKVQQLEMENKWLKNLLVEKNEGNDEIVTLWKEFAATRQTSDKSSESKQASSIKEER
ncbi:hypothetical protein BGZ63DRAFT_345574 [Mariannaea sp. PMI_226]|nr:hypothetical protein BGZ63DRAFT_345574 [Mariannaea sp. PMI_226]